MAKLSYTVQVFAKGDASLLITAPCIKNSNRVPVDVVVAAVRRKLSLKEKSFGIFGLFLGPLGSPKKLLLSGTVMPEDVPLQLAYQRICFDAAMEKKAIKTDSVALNLIFWEVKHMLDSNKIWPPPTLLQVIEMKQVLSKHREAQGLFFSIEQKRTFMEHIYILSLFYWSRYNLVKGVILNSSMTSFLRLSEKVMVALEYDKLVLIDDTKPCSSLCLPWSLVKSIWLEKKEKCTFVAEVLVPNKAIPVMRKIYLETACSKYIFSITVHILKLHDKRAADASKPPVINWFHSFLIYHNPVFIKEK